jgi:hypothetical protein
MPGQYALKSEPLRRVTIEKDFTLKIFDGNVGDVVRNPINGASNQPVNTLVIVVIWQVLQVIVEISNTLVNSQF